MSDIDLLFLHKKKPLFLGIQSLYTYQHACTHTRKRDHSLLALNLQCSLSTLAHCALKNFSPGHAFPRGLSTVARYQPRNPDRSVSLDLYLIIFILWSRRSRLFAEAINARYPGSGFRGGWLAHPERESQQILGSGANAALPFLALLSSTTQLSFETIVSPST